MSRQTYKCSTMIEALLPMMKKLTQQNKNAINYLKTGWKEIAPNWAQPATPYMIKNNTLFMKTDSAYATILQYREQEMLKIITAILGEVQEEKKINKIKIIKN